MEWTYLENVLLNAKRLWETREITFLGGEPTLYPKISDAIAFAQQQGYEVRLVTNGGHHAERLLTTIAANRRIHVAVSVDGSHAARHDAIRKNGSFKQATTTISKAQERGHSTSAILSVGTHNINDARATIDIMANLGVDYVNIHYVTDRGYATSDMMVSPFNWLQFCKEIRSTPPRVQVRFEETFIPSDSTLSCSARNRRMLMFFPDKRVFTCSMYIDSAHGNQYWWSNDKLTLNGEFDRQFGPTLAASLSCPAVATLHPELEYKAAAAGCHIGCIFQKESMPQ